MPDKVDFSFDDRVARRYDHQRAHPAAVSEKIGAAISAVVPGTRKRVLEIGVGTGRIARPVAAAGCEVFGFDISGDMLAELATTERLRVFRGDMHALPFPAASFDAVLVVHVLHLTQEWQQVLTEVARVLRSGGVFIQGDDWVSPESVIGKLRNEMRAEAFRQMPQIMPPGATANRQEVLAGLGGGEMREIVAAEWQTQITPAQRLKTIAAKQDSESWVLPDALFDHMVPHLRNVAAATWDDLDAPQPVDRRFILKVIAGTWDVF